MNEDSETDYESNMELKYPSISKSNSNINEQIFQNNTNIYKTNEISFGIIFTIFLILCLSDLGDKSQITVITMAAIYDLYGILIGSTFALLGTVTLAVLFGTWICEKVSPKILFFIGGLIFLIFGGEVLLNVLYDYLYL